TTSRGRDPDRDLRLGRSLWRRYFLPAALRGLAGLAGALSVSSLPPADSSPVAPALLFCSADSAAWRFFSSSCTFLVSASSRFLSSSWARLTASAASFSISLSRFSEQPTGSH